MSDKQIYIAYFIDKNELGQQLLRYPFEHPRVEFWAANDVQKSLKDYFEENHYTRERPDFIEESDMMPFWPYSVDIKRKQ